MRCSTCPKDAIFHQPYSGKSLCPVHLRRDVESRIRHTIRARRWLGPRDHIGVFLTGDCRSSALLIFLNDLLRLRRDTRMTAMIMQESEKSPGLEVQLALAAERRIPVVMVPGVHGIGSVAERSAGNRHDPGKNPVRETPAPIIPETSGRDLGLSKIATTRSLDDAAGAVLSAFMNGAAGELFAGQEETEPGRLTFIHPFIAIPGGEIDLYAKILGLESGTPELTKEGNGFPGHLEALLDDYTGRHPSAKYSLVHLGEEIRRAGARPGTIVRCTRGGMPGQEICTRCSPEDEEST